MQIKLGTCVHAYDNITYPAQLLQTPKNGLHQETAMTRLSSCLQGLMDQKTRKGLYLHPRIHF